MRQGRAPESLGVATVGDAMRRGLNTTPAAMRAPVQAGGAEGADEVSEPAGAVSVEADAPTQNTSAENSKIERARNLLKRAGWQDPDFEKFSREQILRRAQIAEKASNREAKLRAENEALRKRLSGQATNDSQGSSIQASQASTTGAVVPPVIDVKALAKKLAQGDPELEAQFAAELQTELNPALSRLDELGRHEQSRLAEGAAGQVEARKQVQSQLSGVYPDLANDDDFQEFLSVSNGLKQTARFARADEDPVVAQELVHAAAAALGLEAVGERAEPTQQQRAVGRGFMEPKGAALGGGRSEAIDDKRRFMAAVQKNLARMSSLD